LFRKIKNAHYIGVHNIESISTATS